MYVNLTELSPQDDWKHRISIPCTLFQKQRMIPASGIVDSGATGKAFMNASFAQRHGFKRTRLNQSIDLKAFNGTRTISARVTPAVKLYMRHEDRQEFILMYLTTLGKHDFILGEPWNWEHEVNIDYCQSKLRFGAEACKNPVLPEPDPRSVLLDQLPETFATPPSAKIRTKWTPTPPKRWSDWQHDLRLLIASL
jgi:hypothetical protein